MPIFVYPEYATQTDEQAALVRHQKVEQLVEECRFATIVSTASGSALLIGSRVVDVVADDAELLVEAISTALRRGGDARAYGDYTKSSASAAAEENYRAAVAGYGLAGYGMHGCPIRG